MEEVAEEIAAEIEAVFERSGLNRGSAGRPDFNASVIGDVTLLEDNDDTFPTALLSLSSPVSRLSGLNGSRPSSIINLVNIWLRLTKAKKNNSSMRFRTISTIY